MNIPWYRFVFSTIITSTSLFGFLLVFFCFFSPYHELAARLPTEVEGDIPRDYWQFVFLLDSTTAAGQSEFNIHPFYGQYSNYEKAYDYSYVLYPLFFMHGTNYWKRWTWLNIFSGDSLYHQDTGEDSDLLLTPITIGKGDDEKDGYFGVFPLYGSFRDLFGYDEINYFLFPVYSNWSYKDYKAHGFLWPIAMYGSSEKREDFRILPLYSSKKHEGKYEKTSVLWPFFQWGSLGLDKKEPRHYFMSFPLFGYKWSDQDNLFAWTFLWLPFIGGFVSYGRDTIKEEVDFNLFWFLFQYHESKNPGIERLLVFPFYGYYRFGQLEEEYQPYYKEATFITPLYANLRSYSSVMDTDYDFLTPLYWYAKRYYHKEREEETYLKVWPLFTYLDNSEGRVELSSLSLWPWRSDQFDKVWGVYWSLFQYKQYENDDRYFSLLFRLYSQYWNDMENHHFLLGLEWHDEPDHWSFEFLGGLFGIHKFSIDNDETDWAFEFLWVDISRPETIDSL